MYIAWYLLLAIGLVAIGIASAGHAQSAASKMTPDLYRQMSDDIQYWDAQAKRYQAIRDRASELSPARRNTPLRELNISDEEIREVQSISRQYLPRAYVNISPVVTK
jgi:hypothetical protein